MDPFYKYHRKLCKFYKFKDQCVAGLYTNYQYDPYRFDKLYCLSTSDMEDLIREIHDFIEHDDSNYSNSFDHCMSLVDICSSGIITIKQLFDVDQLKEKTKGVFYDSDFFCLNEDSIQSIIYDIRNLEGYNNVTHMHSFKTLSIAQLSKEDLNYIIGVENGNSKMVLCEKCGKYVHHPEQHVVKTWCANKKVKKSWKCPTHSKSNPFNAICFKCQTNVYYSDEHRIKCGKCWSCDNGSSSEWNCPDDYVSNNR